MTKSEKKYNLYRREVSIIKKKSTVYGIITGQARKFSMPLPQHHTTLQV